MGVGRSEGVHGWERAEAAALPGLGRKCRRRHGRPHALSTLLARPAAATATTTAAAAAGASGCLLLASCLKPGPRIVPARRECQRCGRRFIGHLRLQIHLDFTRWPEYLRPSKSKVKVSTAPNMPGDKEHKILACCRILSHSCYFRTLKNQTFYGACLVLVEGRLRRSNRASMQQPHKVLVNFAPGAS